MEKALLNNQQSWPGSRCVAGVLEGVLLFRPWPREHLVSGVLIGVLAEVLPEFRYRVTLEAGAISALAPGIPKSGEAHSDFKSMWDHS